ncbi:Serine-threonine/tyrosine-protein kinase, catalytic domain [Dillenia turbinata]|uniref:Serine-threonine/tyrosine-protein kinase, catalytic domain n=1 Tax=Dillenia turbinata TaxID=194707 RepID=A0AAN8UDD8_9MAGN
MRKRLILLCLLQIILDVHGSAGSTESPYVFRDASAPKKLPKEPLRLHQGRMEPREQDFSVSIDFVYNNKLIKGIDKNTKSFSKVLRVKLIYSTNTILKRHGIPAAGRPAKEFHKSSPMDYSPTDAPTPSTSVKTTDNAPAPSSPSPAKTWAHSPASPPSSSLHKHHHGGNKSTKTGSTPNHKWHSPARSHQGQGPAFSPVKAPDIPPTSQHFLAPAPSPTTQTSQTKGMGRIIVFLCLRIRGPSFHMISDKQIPLSCFVSAILLSPQVSPAKSSAKKMKAPPPPPVMTLPPPPPNEDCMSLICTEPLTDSAPGSPCGCVWPIQVKLRLNVALYTFFPLVSELAEEIAAGLSLNRSQVQLMGANAASEQLEKTVVLINLVPLGETFNYSTAISTYEKFWNNQVIIRKYLFGAYETLYVHYPGLPPSPPTVSSSINSMDDGPYNNGRDNNGRTIKPLGVDLPTRQKHSLSWRKVILIVLSSVAALVLCTGLACLLLLKSGSSVRKPEQAPQVLMPPFAKPSGKIVLTSIPMLFINSTKSNARYPQLGLMVCEQCKLLEKNNISYLLNLLNFLTSPKGMNIFLKMVFTFSYLTPLFEQLLSGATGLMAGSIASSASLSFSSSNLTYTGSAKTFSLYEIEKATDNFDASRILGEGGSGLVYNGVLDDGTRVAVKVLKRDDQQCGREFFAEVEMLSRLHHRNLVKLIGICTEDHTYCLVYELIPSGSVESHLHGADKETALLDWDARLKIALGAARGLAYLHEDSSPRVIHRDFKSGNILLEHDFTPKVSDFGLARTALDEGNKHISTRVMGTFGYLAPEYAMTGHLLVKSDVYSYGVVLLELLTGRKPVDLTRPPGQENLVAWARPLLTSREGLEIIIDPSLKTNLPLDSMAKVAAIASMCVQPEVAHRPFMGEVVQALKLVCNDFDETKEMASKCCSQEDFSIDVDTKVGSMFDELPETLGTSHTMAGFDPSYNAKLALSTTDLLTSSAGLESQEFGSFRRLSSSGPLRAGRGRQFWQRLRGSSRGSVSEHGFTFKLWAGSR